LNKASFLTFSDKQFVCTAAALNFYYIRKSGEKICCNRIFQNWVMLSVYMEICLERVWLVGWCSSVEELMYRSVISGHEEKHKQLVVENHELREILTYLLTELTMLTHGCCQSQAVDHDDDDDEVLYHFYCHLHPYLPPAV